MFKHSAEHTWVTDEWLWEWLVNIQIPLPPALRDVISMMGKKKKKKREGVGKTTYRAERCYSDSFPCCQPAQLHI